MTLIITYVMIHNYGNYSMYELPNQNRLRGLAALQDLLVGCQYHVPNGENDYLVTAKDQDMLKSTVFNN